MGERFLLASAQGRGGPPYESRPDDLPDDLAQLQQQLTEFRSTHRVRSRLPESFWAAATEVALRYGVHQTARVLHLDYVGLKKRVEQRKRPKRKRAASASAPTFVELVGPATEALVHKSAGGISGKMAG